MKKRFPTSCLALLILALPFTAVSKKIKTNLKIEKTSQKNKAKKEDYSSAHIPTRRVNAGDETIIDITDEGTLKFITDSVAFSGYDKTLTAKKETLFISNNNPWTMNGVYVKITYRDMQGRMLHSRNVAINCKVPPHETRRAEFPSWDTQGDFYYYQSVEPRRAAIPYKIDFQPLSYTIPLP